MANWQVISGSVTAPKGFRAAGIAAGGLIDQPFDHMTRVLSDVSV